MIRRAFFFLFFAITIAAWPVSAAPELQTISVETYHAQLRTAIHQLQKLEGHTPQALIPVVKPLAEDRLVKRSDGKTQLASGEEFASLLRNPASNSASPQTIKAVRQGVSLRLDALEGWSQSTFVSSDAQAMIAQLENTNQIRTKPTWLQQSWANLYKWLTETFKNFTAWLESLFPPSDSRATRQIDPLWIQVVFAVTVFILLSLIGYLIWRAIEGRKLQKQAQPFALSPEDSALLQLSPEELRARAQRLAEESDFREALRHLYIALLLTLDAREVWHYDPRRTNWEHIETLKNQSAAKTLIAPLSAATHRFDRVRYGHAACTHSDWIEFQHHISAAERAVGGAQ